MKALLLNSGSGSRMGALTVDRPKCMVDIRSGGTILRRQLALLSACGVTEIVVTTGFYHDTIKDYCQTEFPDLKFQFVKNHRFAQTNYIYSMFLAGEYLDDDTVLMHGDLVFEKNVLAALLESACSAMTVSSTEPLPEKDFKAVMTGERIRKVGVEFFESAWAAQPLYLLRKGDWQAWRAEIAAFCAAGKTSCYAEAALNEILDRIVLRGLDVKDALCGEIDTAEDLKTMNTRMGGAL